MLPMEFDVVLAKPAGPPKNILVCVRLLPNVNFVRFIQGQDSFRDYHLRETILPSEREQVHLKELPISLYFSPLSSHRSHHCFHDRLVYVICCAVVSSSAALVSSCQE